MKQKFLTCLANVLTLSAILALCAIVGHCQDDKFSFVNRNGSPYIHVNYPFDNFSSGSLNNIVDACQQSGSDVGAQVNSALASLPSSGGNIWVDRSCAGSFATGIVVNKPVHIIFDCGQFTYTGAVAAITISSTSGSGVIIEGCSSGDENLPTRGTSFTSTNTAAGGIDMQNCQSCTIQNMGFVGPGSGTGIGAHLSGNGFVADNIEIALFGGDGVQVDGTRANANSFTLKRVKSAGNIGKGFNTFGVNSNLGVWIETNGMSNTGTQYVFNNTFDHQFVALHAQPSSDVTAIQFISSSGNYGGIYMEPQSPFAANVITFDASSLNNNFHLFNGRSVSDLGTGNLVFFSASDAGSGIAGWYQGIRQTAPSSISSGSFSPVEALQRLTTNAELTQYGMFFKSASVVTGATLTGKASYNLIYNTSNGGYHFRIFNNCTGDISLCTPIGDISTNWMINGGVNGDGSGVKHKRVSSCTTAAAANANCQTTVTWTTAFADSSYTASCTIDQPSVANGLFVANTLTRAAGSMLVVVQNTAPNAAATNGFVNCIAMHD